MRDLHVSLGEDTVARLDQLSRQLKTSRNTLVREALEEYLLRRKREAEALEMARYAAVMAPHSGEFVRESGAAVNTQLV